MSRKLYEDRKQARRERRSVLAHMPYAKYLQTKEWKEFKQGRLRSARNRCQVCNSADVQLEVHHRTYERRGYELKHDVIVLCRDCHQLFHENRNLVRQEL